MLRMLLYELFEADVVGAQFAYPIENTAFTGVKEGEVLGHLRQRSTTAIIEHNIIFFVN